MREGRASRTAVLVCQGRAVADGRLAAGRFSDPVAMGLLHADEREVVERVREGQPPEGWSPRVAYEAVRASAQVCVPRTVAIDDAVRSHHAPQLVILGAGLDSRAWRMAELHDVDVYEVDHPASQGDKRSRVAGMTATAGSVTFVPVDLSRERLDKALTAAGHLSTVDTTWVWEGVIPYLTKQQVVATMREIGELSTVGSHLIVNYQSRSTVARVGRLAARLMALGGGSPWSGEPIRSTWTPPDLAVLMTWFGFDVITDCDLYGLAQDLAMPIQEAHSLRTGRVAVARAYD